MSGRPSDDGEGRKVFVGGIALGVDQQDIRDEFGKFGDVDDVFLPQDRDTGKPRGFGFVTFRDARDAEDAAKGMNGYATHSASRHFSQTVAPREPRMLIFVSPSPFPLQQRLPRQRDHGEYRATSR